MIRLTEPLENARKATLHLDDAKHRHFHSDQLSEARCDSNVVGRITENGSVVSKGVGKGEHFWDIK